MDLPWGWNRVSSPIAGTVSRTHRLSGLPNNKTGYQADRIRRFHDRTELFKPRL